MANPVLDKNPTQVITDIAPNTHAIIEELKQMSTEGPGKILARLRKSMEISEMDAASKMHMSVSQLRALENDKFDELPAPIYVKNFCQRYANLVGLPPTEVIACFERFGHELEPELARVSYRDKIDSRHISMRWAMYTVTVLLLILAILWGHSAGIGESLTLDPIHAKAISDPELSTLLLPEQNTVGDIKPPEK